MQNKFSVVNAFMKVMVISIASIALFTGCSTKLQTQKEIGTLNLQSEKLKQLKATEHVIAIVSPKIAAGSMVTQVQNQVAQSPVQMMLMQRGYSNSNSKYDFNSAFSTTYAERLDKALESSVSEIISSKGFKLKGPYGVFDDMTYQDKKKIYLAFVPQIDFSIENKVIKQERNRLYTHTNGVIQIGGSLIISMIEPMTGQVFIKRRINLSDFNIQEPYVYERQTNYGSGGIIGTAIDKGSAPEKLIDTTDVALTKAINKFYAKTIPKINSYLDKELSLIHI